MFFHPPMPEQQFPGSRPAAVLVAEDDDDVRALVSELLRDAGYDVIEAASVAAARTSLLQRSVDVVFSDIDMPGGEDGFDLQHWVRRHRPHIKVLLTTGGAPDPADVASLEQPPLAKPYSLEEVLRRIERMCRTG